MYFTVSNPKHFKFFSKTTQLDSGINSHRVSTLGWCFSCCLNHQIMKIHFEFFDGILNVFFIINQVSIVIIEWGWIQYIWVFYTCEQPFLISCVKIAIFRWFIAVTIQSLFEIYMQDISADHTEQFTGRIRFSVKN